MTLPAGMTIDGDDFGTNEDCRVCRGRGWVGAGDGDATCAPCAGTGLADYEFDAAWESEARLRAMEDGMGW